MLREESLDFEPGTQFAYSNFGYYALGRVIEAVTGLSYEEYVRNEILEPIGITRMSIGEASAESREAGEVRYYDYPESAVGAFRHYRCAVPG